MSLAERVLRSYRAGMARGCEIVTVRRYAGKGPARAVSMQADALARVVGYQPDELVGAVQQGDRKAIVINDPSATVPVGKVTLSTMLPLTSDDKLVIDGREVAIVGRDDAARRIQGVVIAIELQVRG